LVPVAAGEHTAQMIPGAKLEIVQGKGHDLPPGLVSTLTGLILDHCRTVDETTRRVA
jgi:proline iminopeptidase